MLESNPEDKEKWTSEIKIFFLEIMYVITLFRTFLAVLINRNPIIHEKWRILTTYPFSSLNEVFICYYKLCVSFIKTINALKLNTCSYLLHFTPFLATNYLRESLKFILNRFVSLCRGYSFNWNVSFLMWMDHQWKTC